MDTSGMSGMRRRALLACGSALGAALFGLHNPAVAEPAPETKRLRLVHAPFICMAPQYLAEELLAGKGSPTGSTCRSVRARRASTRSSKDAST